MCTALESEGVQIATIEHVMAALAGGGIDNLLIEIHGPELPIMDGSAWPFVFLIECAGVVELEAPRRFVKILRPVTLAAGGRSVALAAGRGLLHRLRGRLRQPAPSRASAARSIWSTAPSRTS